MKILNQIKLCSSVGRHAWYKTDLGFRVRKPIDFKRESFSYSNIESITKSIVKIS